MGIYTRGNKIWIRFRDVEGKWRSASSGYDVGDEAKAYEVLSEVEARVERERGATRVLAGEGATMTVRQYAHRWLEQRESAGIGSVRDERSRLYNHVIPVIGDIALGELRAKHVRELMAKLAKKKRRGQKRRDGSTVKADTTLAPRTVLHCYRTLRQMVGDAIRDEVIRGTNPVNLKATELPKKRDKDPTWRRTAVFTREELQTIISSPDIPDDRRTFYALMLVGGMRFGEVAALTWADYEPKAEPLGRLVIDKAFDTRSQKVKGVKTENPREMPVHPTLAKILAEWKLGGFEAQYGRPPKPDDLIVPSRRMKCRSNNHGYTKFNQDLERIGLRRRRQHDARRTFITIARADGARPDLLRWCTHGPTGDMMDVYASPPWETFCDEVAKARIELLGQAEIIELAKVCTGNGPEHALQSVTPPRKSAPLKRKTAEVHGNRTRRAASFDEHHRL